MKVDKVNFIEKKVKGMPKKKFIDAHMPIVWPKMKPEDKKDLRLLYTEMTRIK